MANDFYYKNALQMIFTIKYIANDFYNKKCIGNDFYYKNALQMIFTIKIHWK